MIDRDLSQFEGDSPREAKIAITQFNTISPENVLKWESVHPQPDTYAWDGPAAGEHTLVSRVTDSNGNVQPTADDLATKKTFLEDNSQHPRKVMIG